MQSMGEVHLEYWSVVYKFVRRNEINNYKWTNSAETGITRCDQIEDNRANVYDAGILLGCRLDSIASPGHSVATNHILQSRCWRYQDTSPPESRSPPSSISTLCSPTRNKGYSTSMFRVGFSSFKNSNLLNESSNESVQFSIGQFYKISIRNFWYLAKIHFPNRVFIQNLIIQDCSLGTLHLVICNLAQPANGFYPNHFAKCECSDYIEYFPLLP